MNSVGLISGNELHFAFELNTKWIVHVVDNVNLKYIYHCQYSCTNWVYELKERSQFVKKMLQTVSSARNIETKFEVIN